MIVFKKKNNKFYSKNYVKKKLNNLFLKIKMRNNDVNKKVNKLKNK